jgi:heme exporter protein B
MLNQHIIFGDDEEDGSLEQIILSGLSPYQIIIAKIIVYFLLSFAPLVIFLPLLGLALYNLTFQNVIMLVAVILCCSLSFAVVNIFAAALNLGIRARQIVASIIIAPLSVSTLIFGAYSLIEQSYSGLTLLASLLMVLTPILIFASSLLLR